ncbi:MAG: hypothetical protein ABFD60_08435 [Bryobacteraceae bacterium]
MTFAAKVDKKTKFGMLKVFDAFGEVYECACLGRADAGAAKLKGNPSADPLKIYGDTPEGTYRVTRGGVLTPLRSYGPSAVLILTPTAGPALEAAKVRSGLLIHGGALTVAGILRVTHGCLRVMDTDQYRLVTLVRGTTEPVSLTVEYV